jgi:hypothetical protein
MSGKKVLETYYVSFYTKANAALRENLIMKATGTHDGRLLRAAENKGRRLGAHHFHVFECVPRPF